jgi:hypothetical protein
MNPMPGLPKLLVLSLLGAGLAACGSAEPAPPSGVDRASAEEELAQVTAALGEPTCGSTAPDATLANAVYGYVTSPNASYDHPTCRNAFVIEMNGLTAGKTVYGGPASTPTLEPFSCVLHWVHGSLWKKDANGVYTKVIEDNRLGTFQAVWRTGFACSARVALPVVEDGDYKLVLSGGYLFGPYRVVDASAY